MDSSVSVTDKVISFESSSDYDNNRPQAINFDSVYNDLHELQENAYSNDIESLVQRSLIGDCTLAIMGGVNSYSHQTDSQTR